METRTEKVADLFRSGLFNIPEYQRSYSWTDPQLKDLIEDLKYLPEDQVHFFGNVILENKDNSYETERGRELDVYEVVDGQQRLTSAMIFLKVACELSEEVREGVNEANLLNLPRDRPRLVLQDQDKVFFQDDILGPSTLSPETPSQQRLRRARTLFKETLQDVEEEDISTLSSRLRYRFRLNVVEVADDSEAASIFESINTRGKELSSLEKTKSFLMYTDDRVGGSLRSDINDCFGRIYRDLFVLEEGHHRVEDFDEESFQRFHWGMYDGYDSNEYYNSLQTFKTRLFEKYREGKDKEIIEKIKDYTKSLREASDAFKRLFSPSKYEDSVKRRLIRLLELGRMANVLPVLIASQLKYGDSPNKMKNIIERCETLVFRVYAIDGRRSDTGRHKLVKLAHNIYSNDYGVEKTIEKLEKITYQYTSDSRFKRELQDPEFYKAISSKDILYLLYHYGQELESQTQEIVRKDLKQILLGDFSVEHILAQGLDDENKPENLEDEFEEYVHRLGNLTIAKNYWNQSYGNLPFKEKKEVPEESSREKAYENSTLIVQRILSSIDEFDREEILRREEEIVEFALEEWSIEIEPSDSKGSKSESDTVEIQL